MDSNRSRRDVYRRLLRDSKHHGRMLGIITCKRLREPGEQQELRRVLALLRRKKVRRFVDREDLHLVFTGGTYHLLEPVLGGYSEYKGRLHGLASSALGVIQLANLVVYGHLHSIFFFNHMEDLYADSPQNLCLRRLCNYYDMPLFEDLTSIQFAMSGWLTAGSLPRLNQASVSHPVYNDAQFYGPKGRRDKELLREDHASSKRTKRRRETVAVVAHNEMKMRMLNFCLGHMPKILTYRRVLTTGTTGARLRELYGAALRLLREHMARSKFDREPWTPESGRSVKAFLDEKIQPFESGPMGGDIQISCKVIDGTCHRVLFFQDPQTAHPHQFDIRLMEKAVQDQATGALFATSVETAEMIV